MPSIEVFFSYAHEDEELRDELVRHLKILERQGIIRGWCDRNITAGTEWANQIDQHLESAQVILLLVSADFLASDYCYDVELRQAMERHEAGLAQVIPVILRPVESWQDAPFGKLQALPKDGQPVTTWDNQDSAFADVVQGIRKAVEERIAESKAREPSQSVGVKAVARTGPNPFEYGPPVAPDRFYGRQRERMEVKNRIGAVTPQSINIVGFRRSGKTSLLRYIRERTEEFCPPEQKPLIVSIDLQNAKFHMPVGILEGMRRGIRRLTGVEPWAREANDDPFEVEDGLQALRDQGHRLIVMFDEFEAISQRLDLFQDWGEDWRAKNSAGLLTTVIASKRPLSEIYKSLDLISPFSNIFSTTILGELAKDDQYRLLQNGFGRLSDVELFFIEDIAGGLPFYVQMAASTLWQNQTLEQAKAAFLFQSTPRFQEMWIDLLEPEQKALSSLVNDASLATGTETLNRLSHHGLLHCDSQLFSSAFFEFVREQS